eukprot:994605-Prorocentrum_minimum.AAC.1
MVEAGVAANTVTYNSLINACAAGGAPQEVKHSRAQHGHVASANNLGGELNALVVEWLNGGFMDNSRLWHAFGVRKAIIRKENSTVAQETF